MFWHYCVHNPQLKHPTKIRFLEFANWGCGWGASHRAQACLHDSRQELRRQRCQDNGKYVLKEMSKKKELEKFLIHTVVAVPRLHKNTWVILLKWTTHVWNTWPEWSGPIRFHGQLISLFSVNELPMFLFTFFVSRTTSTAKWVVSYHNATQ